MAVTLWNSFESGQTSGTTISNANSGGGAGNAFDTVTIGTGTTVQYNSTAYRGSLSGASTTTGTSSAASVNWTTSIGTAISHSYGRCVLNASSTAIIINFVRNRAAGTQAFRITVNASGKFEFRNGANGVLATSTTVVSTGAWYMVRWDVPVGASVTGVLYIHTNPTSPTAAETLTANNANFGTTNIDECNFGAAVAATANVAIFRVDDVLLTDQGLPGPPAQSTSLTDTFTTSDAVTRALALPRDVTDTWTTSDAVTRALAAPRPVTDTWTTSDAVTRSTALPRGLTDGWTTSDTVARGLILPRTVTDAWTTSDAVTRAAALTRPVTDTWTTTDAVTRAVALPRTVTDGWTSTDVATKTGTYARTVTDTYGVADTVDRALALPRPVVDSIGVTDTADRATALTRAVVDGWITADVADRILTVARQVTDGWTTSDVATGHTEHMTRAVFVAGYPGTPWITPQAAVTTWPATGVVTTWTSGGPM